MSADKIHYRVAMTPNPHSKKFIFEALIKTEGKSFYEDAAECGGNPLAQGLFRIAGIQKIGIFGNVVTISKTHDCDWDTLEDDLQVFFDEQIPAHNPLYTDSNPVEERRSALPPIVQQIEEILDRTVRPYIQQDGGDLECLAFDDNILTINYKGACGSCPSSMAGTLASITQTLRAELNLPELEVIVGNNAEPVHYHGNKAMSGGGYPGMWDDVADYEDEDDEDLHAGNSQFGKSASGQSSEAAAVLEGTKESKNENENENKEMKEEEIDPTKQSIKERINRISKIFKN
jgi:Fe-S cluster biogenesis protein NfuA